MKKRTETVLIWRLGKDGLLPSELAGKEHVYLTHLELSRMTDHQPHIRLQFGGFCGGSFMVLHEPQVKHKLQPLVEKLGLTNAWHETGAGFLEASFEPRRGFQFIDQALSMALEIGRHFKFVNGDTIPSWMTNGDLFQRTQVFVESTWVPLLRSKLKTMPRSVK